MWRASPAIFSPEPLATYFQPYRRTILETESPDILEALEGSPSGQAFARKLEGLIHEFRYLSEKDEDMSLPRWDEDPTLALATLKSFVQAGGDEDPQKHMTEQKDGIPFVR